MEQLIFSYKIYQDGVLIEQDKIFADSEEDAINYLRGPIGGEDMDIRVKRLTDEG